MGTTDQLRRVVEELCDAFDHVDRRGTARTTDAVRASLNDTVRLAVVGRVKAGKSTLVNALIGRRVAPTSAAECTSISTHYRFGGPERGELRLRDGSVVPLDLVNGGLPERLPVPIDAIANGTVYLQSELLRDLTLIDTPGLATTTEGRVDATRRAVLGHEGVREADALVYVFHDMPLRDDVEFLQEWGNVTNVPGAQAGRAVGVLSHADTFGGDPWGTTDVFAAAREGAARFARQHGASIGTVVPIGGIMAQAARTGQITEANALSLSRLREADDLDLELCDATVPGEFTPGVSNAEVGRLLHLLGAYGVRHGRQYAAAGARELREWLLRASGIEELRRALAARYIGRFAFVKARRGVEMLERLAWTNGAPPPLRAIIAEARLDPRLHPLAELDAAERLAVREPGHPLLGDLDVMLGSRTDAERVGLSPSAPVERVRDEALRRSADSRRNGALEPYPERANALRVLERSYTLIAMRVASPRGR